MKVRITKRHIAEGTQNSARKCPIALALSDSGACHAAVFITWAYVDGGSFTLAEQARQFTANFDAGRPVSPGWLTVWE